MRGKIACSAQRLSLLDPHMVQSVVNGQAFQVGEQYRTENRVRVVDADDRQVSSVVIGNSGVYQVSIQLKDGALTTKCSCPLNNEQPLCRHSVAVLLEYHRWTQSRASGHPPVKTNPPPQAVPPGSASASVSALDVKLSDVMVFLGWLETFTEVGGRDTSLPDVPALSGEALKWVKAVQDLEERRRASEERSRVLEADVRAREAHLGRLTEQLQASMEEAKATQRACEQLRREVAAYAAMQLKVSETATAVEALEAELKRIGGDAIKQLSQLNGLADACKDAAGVLHQLAKKP